MMATSQPESMMYHKPIWHLTENVKQLGAVSGPLSSNCFHGGKKYLELPDGDAEVGMCGMVKQSMYGARDAAHQWEQDYVYCMSGK